MEPWMSVAERETILKYLKLDDIMLEYGCGGSTLFFARFVKKYYSVEHNREWYDKMFLQVGTNTRLFHVPINSGPAEAPNRIFPHSWDELDGSSRSKDFHDYIRYPGTLDQKFDAVLIDGRARPECAKFIKDYITDDGFMFMHDYWDRPLYHVVEEQFEVIDHVKSGQSLAVFKKK